MSVTVWWYQHDCFKKEFDWYFLFHGFKDQLVPFEPPHSWSSDLTEHRDSIEQFNNSDLCLLWTWTLRLPFWWHFFGQNGHENMGSFPHSNRWWRFKLVLDLYILLQSGHLKISCSDDDDFDGEDGRVHWLPRYCWTTWNNERPE